MRDIKESKTKYKIPAPSKIGRWDNGVFVSDSDMGDEYHHYVNGGEFIENFSFYAELSYVNYQKRRSSYVMRLTDGKNVFPVAASKLDELMREALTGSKFIGRFTFFKQGENYSIGLYRGSK